MTRAVAIGVGLSLVVVAGCGGSQSNSTTSSSGTTTSLTGVRPTSYYLEGGGVSITYYPHGPDGRGQAQLSFQEPGFQANFKGAEIRRVDVPGLGGIVTVNGRRYLPFATSTFSIIMPSIGLSPSGNGSAPVKTEGIRMVFAGDVISPGRQLQQYGVVHLVGEARR